MRGEAELSDLDFAAFLQCVYRTIQGILHGNAWASAFRGVGFGDAQTGLERFVRRNTGVSAASLALPCDRPPNAEFATCFDSRYRPQFDDLWRILVPPVRAVRLGPAVGAARAKSKASAKALRR